MKYSRADILGSRYKKFISERIHDKIDLNEWRIDRIFRLDLSNNTNYIQVVIESEKLESNEKLLDAAISAISEVFQDSFVDDQKIGKSYTSGVGFWIIIEDVDHENSWYRIK